MGLYSRLRQLEHYVRHELHSLFQFIDFPEVSLSYLLSKSDQLMDLLPLPLSRFPHPYTPFIIVEIKFVMPCPEGDLDVEGKKLAEVCGRLFGIGHGRVPKANGSKVLESAVNR